MKIDINLDALWASVHRMGAEHLSLDLGVVWDNADIEFDKELSSTGIEIDLKDLVSEQGLLSIKGRQVLLFIPDHNHRVEDALADGSKGNKFHIAHCSKLDEMKRRNRFERYHVTNNLSGEFEIFGYDRYRQHKKDKTRLNVCKLCLSHLNYKGASSGTATNRNDIVREFDIGEFFSTYSSLFKYLPKTSSAQTTGYTSDWKEFSAKVRQSAGYICQKCHVDLTGHKNLLHVHHKNGVKSDNSPNNLQPLCADCHRKEDLHDHMFVRHSDTQLINHLRREQGLINSGDSNWDKVFECADPAVHGFLDYARKKGFAPPEVGYEITNLGGRIIAELELAWPETNYGIYIEKPEVPSSWNLHSLEEAMGFMSKR
ncbi:HNH endonuclease signature motif containing protein [Endozoicomonas sp. GU-1]|uniref:HNH endonuclease signature motif containing protein n=1 Tax=Endozoicomonas sp. GU-1 TaxID=3009078 RepID=UPI0022B48DB3|nr:HNH endonuclease signature motif containing protein [Endozoicomonas sp. GU-1]WBA83539.1 HNH endonuclease signature motif containing protein [Endozoicomonas sp. GU-1]WBA86472.1 HNH endonuclease signature motif containing protein [Endozoicomonas sp. GU-1]